MIKRVVHLISWSDILHGVAMIIIVTRVGETALRAGNGQQSHVLDGPIGKQLAYDNALVVRSSAVTTPAAATPDYPVWVCASG
eukprot:CAMPEP_0115836382 /NCGR_PEP_ID=MMETSP0287-20121206/4678_1 /TAXON_ID=412157 /ORGANISM="Chrysochromulina rotalis, Strain UIO044" /LENGTH=82 /DNA_ID=CAMNT_0003289863 /DNA_START=498 /DNA_END=746 /DNA_ORIENTATION=-